MSLYSTTSAWWLNVNVRWNHAKDGRKTACIMLYQFICTLLYAIQTVSLWSFFPHCSATLTYKLEGMDPDDDPFTFSLDPSVSQQFGTAAVAPDGSFTYEPTDRTSGVDSIAIKCMYHFYLLLMIFAFSMHLLRLLYRSANSICCMTVRCYGKTNYKLLGTDKNGKFWRITYNQQTCTQFTLYF